MTADRLVTRLGLAFSGLFVLTFAAMLLAVLYLTARWAETALDDHLASVADAALERLGAGASPPSVADQVASAAQFVELRDPDWSLIASADVLAGRVIPASPSARRARDDYFETATMTRSRVRVLTRPFLDEQELVTGYVVVASPMPGVGPVLGELLWLIAAAGCVGMLVTVAATWMLSRWVANPLIKLSEEVEGTMTSGLERNITLPAGGTVEVRELGHTIHSLVAQQRELIARERAFFADSSHVLRTPLAILRGNMDLLAEGGSAEERREAWDEARGAIASMSRTVAGLMLLSRDEARQSDDWRIVDCSALVTSLVREARVVAPGVDMQSHVEGGLEVSGDEHQLREMLLAVLENATRYTPLGGRVELHAWAPSGDRVVVELIDNGIGLTDEEARRAQERFFRGYQARKLFPSGTGLGLSIASRLAYLHGGSLSLKPGIGGGTIARIELPRFESEVQEL